MSLEILQILDNFANVKILVIGDVMLDRYWSGNVTRISPEAPVPIVNLEKETLIAGGAANVAANIKGLGATPFLVGLIGNDLDGNLLKETLENQGVTSKFLFSAEDRPTTTKTRVLAHKQQIARVDQESNENLEIEIEGQVFDKIKGLFEICDLVIISDYNKGFLSENLLQRLITQAHILNKKILVDPKGKSYRKYKGSTLLTPNKKEAFEASNLFEVKSAGSYLLEELDLKSILITQGEDGMTVFQKNVEPLHLSALARHVYDVTGAGDTVISTLGVGLAAGANLENAARIANRAAGFVVEEIGTSIIQIGKLRKSFE